MAVKSMRDSLRGFSRAAETQCSKGVAVQFAGQNITVFIEKLEARGGIEPPIKVLQTFALPLGDRASAANLFYQMKSLHGLSQQLLLRRKSCAGFCSKPPGL